METSPAEKLVLTARTLERGLRLFEDEEAFQVWLRTPSWPLGGRTPLELLETDAGIRVVDDEIGRIAHGILA